MGRARPRPWDRRRPARLRHQHRGLLPGARARGGRALGRAGRSGRGVLAAARRRRQPQPPPRHALRGADGPAARHPRSGREDRRRHRDRRRPLGAAAAQRRAARAEGAVGPRGAARPAADHEAGRSPRRGQAGTPDPGLRLRPHVPAPSGQGRRGRSRDRRRHDSAAGSARAPARRAGEADCRLREARSRRLPRGMGAPRPPRPAGQRRVDHSGGEPGRAQPRSRLHGQGPDLRLRPRRAGDPRAADLRPAADADAGAPGGHRPARSAGLAAGAADPRRERDPRRPAGGRGRPWGAGRHADRPLPRGPGPRLPDRRLRLQHAGRGPPGRRRGGGRGRPGGRRGGDGRRAGLGARLGRRAARALAAGRRDRGHDDLARAPRSRCWARASSAWRSACCSATPVSTRSPR